MAIESSPLKVCEDYLLFIANGEMPAEADETRELEILRGVKREQSTGGHVVVGEKELGYSPRPCECCRNHHHGNRYEAFLLTEKKARKKAPKKTR